MSGNHVSSVMDRDRFELQDPPVAESDVERRIMADARWRRGALWGVPRPGHPEGQVINHVRDVLANVDRFAPDDDGGVRRAQLRLIALLHDICKCDARLGGPHHGKLARRVAEDHVDDPDVLDVIELHDEAYACWRLLDRGRVLAAHARADALLDRIGHCLELYLAFYRCDTLTEGKHRGPLEWFETFVGAMN
jgi:hypothetical protein